MQICDPIISSQQLHQREVWKHAMQSELTEYRLLAYTKTVVALKAHADWLVKLRISCTIYFWAAREKTASRFASATSEEII